MLADVVGLLAAYLFATSIYGAGGGDADSVPFTAEIVGLILLLPIWIALGRVFGLHTRDDERADHTTVDDFAGVFTMVTIGTWLFVAAAWILDIADPYMPKLLLFWLSAVVLVTLARTGARAIYRRSPDYVQTAVILGADEIGQLVASKIRRHPEYGIRLAGFVDTIEVGAGPSDQSVPIIGEPARLSEIVDSHGVERVIVAFSRERLSALVEELRSLRSSDIQVDLVPRFYDVVGPRAGFHTVEGLPLVSLTSSKPTRTSRMAKRWLDVLGSVTGLVLLSPLFAFIAWRIKLDSPGPVFFRQERVGRDGAPFRVAKFRTMYVSPNGGSEAGELDPALAEEFRRNFKLRDDPRVTPFGAWLRRRSLDELPQLWNVLRGEMSLVGPRPVTREEISQRDAGAAAELLTVKPGMTGYWQINGRSDADYDDRIRLELSYVGNPSLGLDIAILVKTLGVLVSRRGAC